MKVSIGRRDAAESAHGADPEVSSALVEREREHGLMRKAIELRGPKTFHAPFSYSPSPFSVPAQMRFPSTSTQKTWLSGRPFAVVKFSQRKIGMSWATAMERRMSSASVANQNSSLHSVFRYSMRSFNSSLVRSLLTPWVSFGLNTVQISSSDRAEPSCRYGAE